MNQESGRPESSRPSTSLSRRRLLQLAGVAGLAAAAGPQLGPITRSQAAELAQARAEIGTRARPFELGQVRLTASRWMDNQNRTLAYLRFVDVDRLLYNFRANHRLSTNGAAALGGWDAPNFPFRTHMQGHFLTAWAQAWAVLGDTTCRDKANDMVAELAKCQANNGAAGFTTGYLSGFPESDFTAVETGHRQRQRAVLRDPQDARRPAGRVALHRQHPGARRAAALRRLGRLAHRPADRSRRCRPCCGTEFGGMNAVLADLYQQTGDARWLTVAQRFDHAAVFDPLGVQPGPAQRPARQHAGAQVDRRGPRVQGHRHDPLPRHRRATPGTSPSARTRTPSAATARPSTSAPRTRSPTYLANDTCEQCNTYNMLKLTRELWLLDPDNAALLRLLRAGAAQPPDRRAEPGRQPRAHHLLHPAATRRPARASGPAWGGGTWSTDYNSFWCCQGTGIETNTKLMDSIYFYNGTTLTVNLFMPSVLTWTAARHHGHPDHDVPGRATPRP